MKLLKSLYTFTIAAVTASVFPSCVNNWLEEEPADGIDAETAIQTSSDLANVRTGMYAAIKGNSSLINYYARLMFIYGDIRGEDVQYEYEGGSGRASFYYYMTYSTADDFTTSTAVWQMPWVVIGRANRIIEAAEEGNLTDAEESASTIAQYEAEAKVIRAMALFDLTRIYGKPYTMDQGASLGVPLVTSSLESTDKPARSTVAECYDAVEQDLNDAIDSGALYEDNDQNYYINLWAAKALLVRLYITKGEWNNALSVAEDIIENSPYQLWTASEYVDAWQESNASHANEMLFEIKINDSTDWTDREGIAYVYAENSSASPGYGDVVVTQSFAEMLMSDPSDVRNDVLVASEENSEKFDGYKVYINKMPPVNGDVRYADVPMLRLSEVYLSGAEAAYEAGNTSKAAELLNAIITNRTTDADKTVTASDITLDRIYIERRKELVGEGQRYFDVLRRGETVVRYESVNDRGWHDILTEEARTFNRESKKALPLIPVAEINANPNMEQNPSY